MRPAQANIVFELMVDSLLKVGTVLQFAFLGRDRKLVAQILKFLPFLIPLLDLPLQTGAQPQ